MEEQSPSTLKKIEFGFLELIVGALMIIGIIGYFGHVNADLDWLDHTISFGLFTYLFYKLNITSILFGHTRKGLNVLIVISFFLLFFKDIITYTLATPREFVFLMFIASLQDIFAQHIGIITNLTFYAGLAGLVIVSVAFALTSSISHPSMAYALFAQQKERKVVNMMLCILLLIAFYYFVYNMILEWLEFVLDDPIIATGIILYIQGLASKKERFHPESFVFKIGEFSEGLYSRFVSLFHYKQTLPLAISGLLILHALADLGVFAYAFSSGKENLYLESFEQEHPSWWELFWEDSQHATTDMAWVLGALYTLNAVSMILFLLIPAVVWWRMFTHKELHLNRALLFVIYASAIAFVLLPAYGLLPLSEQEKIVGVDIMTTSLLSSSSPLDKLIPNKEHVIRATLALSLLAGALAVVLSLNQKAKKELYALAIACSLLFYGMYLYQFMGSVLVYLGEGIMLMVQSSQWILMVFFALIFMLSVLFYIGGYGLFVYEVVMEYHRQKWSEPVDEELVKIFSAMKRFEQKIEQRQRRINKT